MTDSGAESNDDTTFFNLVDEPWVLVLDENGQQRELSMRETFHRAAEMRALSGDIATQTFAILRVLLAVLGRAVFGRQ
ncbi:MAG: type I-E CRISPR-associated protein Cse1/CasA, partial [Propionibacteriaceae bacterium]|nr:type I-E CRISPR-associated protein Cse1/CasA [Propionibacteriaceae bacterium]